MDLRHTFMCVSCGEKPAYFWCGHVLRGDEHILAGYCRECHESGCRGRYVDDMEILEEVRQGLARAAGGYEA